MFTVPLKTRAYLLTESHKNRTYLLVLVLGDAFQAKEKGVVSKIFLGHSPRPLPVLFMGISLLKSYSSPHLPKFKEFSLEQL